MRSYGSYKSTSGTISCIPVSISQLKDASAVAAGSEDLILHSKPLHHVEVVARVANFSDQNIKITFTLYDERASYEGVFFVTEKNSTVFDEFRYKPNHYVRVGGEVKVFCEVYGLVCQSIRNVTSADEVAAHRLSVLQITVKKPKPGAVRRV
jgi:exonuclease VII large subunit